MQLTSLIKPGMRAVFYGRHSTDRQTMETQRDVALQLIEKYKCICVGEYLDAAVSAREKNMYERDGLSQLLAESYLNKYDFVVVSEHDRLARNPREHILIRETMRCNKIPVVIANTESFYDSGELILDLIKDGNSKYEIDNTRNRTTDTMKTLFKNGKWRGGKPPFGYRYNKHSKKIEPVEHQLQLVRMIFGMYSKFDGFDAIAGKLPSGSYDGCDWTDQAVRAVVTNPFYAGYFVHGRKKQNARNSFNDRKEWQLVQSELIPVVINLEEWERCWDLYQKRSEGSIPPNRFKTSFLLRDILKCDDCGLFLQGKDQTSKGKGGQIYGKKIYICPSCNYKIEISKVHRIVDYLLNDLGRRHEQTIVEKVIESFNGDIDQLNRECYELKTAIAQLRDKMGKFEQEIAENYKQHFVSEENEPKKSSAKTMIRILTMSKQNCEQQIAALEIQLQEKECKINRISTLETKPEQIKIKLNEIKGAERQSSLLRGLLFEFVKVILVESKGGVTIIARHDIMQTQI